MEIRRLEDRYEIVSELGTFPLPHPAQLREQAWAAALGEGEKEVAELYACCSFDYEIVRGKDMFEQLVELVVRTDAETAAILNDMGHPAVSLFWGILLEFCPSLESSRVVVVEE